MERRPKIIVCTHFSELFADSINLAGRCPDIIFKTMQVATREKTEGEPEHVLLFRLADGHASSSYGVKISA